MAETDILLFDGVCNLCNGAVNFIIDRDPAARFRFASLQSETGKALLRQYGLSEQKLDSIVLIRRGKAFVKSDAALKVAQRLTGGWPLLSGFRILPRFLRDTTYDFVARNRYKWFGRQEACRLPTPELRNRFI